ncbi:MAG TPA: cation:dicarboxylase symporter family transporter [Candidatus Nitrosotenuis sp.]|jgi:Na+/H+-dicarboxylate symporter|nr:cation:dicarboxylase symporter family transporter [Candidatus Nitrosotenuis sp.]
MLKNLPVQLLISIVLAYFLGNYFDLNMVRGFYALSCLLKSILMFILPLVIFSCIATAIVSMEHRGPILIIAVISLICVSNIAAVTTAYLTGQAFLPWLTHGKLISANLNDVTITPLFEINLPQLLSPGKAMVTGMITGLILSMVDLPVVKTLVMKMRDGVTHGLKKGFIPFLPLYVFGFVLKMQYEGNLVQLFENYGQILLLIVGLVMTYVTFLYGIGTQFRPKAMWAAIRTMMPAGITGFSTMSSAATMPVTLTATEKNVKDAQFTHFVIPTTVNIHLLADALGIPLLGLAILVLSGQALPDVTNYMIFAAYFCLAKFSTAAIPGGGVLVLLPTIQEHLGLTTEMTSLVATLYILQDCFFTSFNVMANGAFAMICHRLLKALKVVRPEVAPSS